jgi:adenine-specific DNA-methyltransferase
MQQDAKSFGVLAAAVPQNEAMYLLSAVFAALLPRDVRSRHGVFFTPPPLVERLLDLVTEAGFEWEHGRAIDPACGGGAFLAPIAARMISAMANAGSTPRKIVDQIRSRIRGIELDPFSAWISQVFVEIAAFEVCRRARSRLPSLVTQANTLETSGPEWDHSFDLVIGNPPYGRVSLHDSLRTKFSCSLYGHANLYGVFTHLATQMVAERGVIGFVTPTSFLGGQYFQKLRTLLIEKAPPFAIDFVEDRTGVFEDVLQETCLATFQSGKRATRVSVHFLKSTLDSATYSIRNAGHYKCNGVVGAPWLLPRTSRHASLIDSAARLPWRLKNYGYSVSTGPLVWNRHKRQLADRITSRCYPLIWAESVRPDGAFEFRCERRNHRPFLKLNTGQEHLLTRGPCVLLQRTTAKEQLRRLIAAVMPSSFIVEHGGAIVENHLNIVRHRHPCDLIEAEARIDLQAIAAVLNCRIVDDVFRCISGSVAVSAFELEELPLPDPGCMSDIQMLVGQGASRDQIEGRVCSAYGIA